MSKKAGIVISILSIIAVVISVTALIICLKPAGEKAEKTDIQYVMYLGTNDKDSNLEAVHSAVDEMIKTFHQSSVLIQANPTITEFYSGSN